jgi:large-conductance mechanosensitive channel
MIHSQFQLKNCRSLAWNGVNVYITNVPEKILTTEEIHDVYFLRYQLMIWKKRQYNQVIKFVVNFLLVYGFVTFIKVTQFNDQITTI